MLTYRVHSHLDIVRHGLLQPLQGRQCRYHTVLQTVLNVHRHRKLIGHLLHVGNAVAHTVQVAHAEGTTVTAHVLINKLLVHFWILVHSLFVRHVQLKTETVHGLDDHHDETDNGAHLHILRVEMNNRTHTNHTVNGNLVRVRCIRARRTWVVNGVEQSNQTAERQTE